ncbi:DUF4296 domain-containing protein [Maribacter cobaltidurans]|uniref:Uncharacterized protein n=1 Tax=Maribacter cobaltidurans TaxID=1178778 RepID=A0A223V558_9FLAO|nr:DUF4296 domain-containing protein [Maribacter cobaltidurans]ASV30523.1 hypothetical protein CJ263_10040 [Maribacter cobaltidurans]GGD79401.1 lipoprotein precursor [Maribacter cobaltidurans]
MRRIKIVMLIVFFTYSCGEKLIEEPENLIPKDKMILVLRDMALINAAKGANLGILKDNAIEPTNYVFEKYKIDSAQFVESDRYYASLPLEYEAIYTEVETILEQKRIQLEQEKKVADSLKYLESKQNKPAIDSLGTSTNLKNDVP